MKIYLVYTSDYHRYDWDILKGFSNLSKAFDYAADVVLEKNNKYTREYVRETISQNYGRSYAYDLFVYTDHHDMDYDYFVGIMEIDAEVDFENQSEMYSNLKQPRQFVKDAIDNFNASMNNQ